jgi:hypothetical protein
MLRGYQQCTVPLSDVNDAIWHGNAIVGSDGSAAMTMAHTPLSSSLILTLNLPKLQSVVEEIFLCLLSILTWTPSAQKKLPCMPHFVLSDN